MIVLLINAELNFYPS